MVVEVGGVQTAQGPGGELGQEAGGAVAVQHARQVLRGGVLPLGGHRHTGCHPCSHTQRGAVNIGTLWWSAAAGWPQAHWLPPLFTHTKGCC